MAPGQRTGIATMDADLARCSANVSSCTFRTWPLWPTMAAHGGKADLTVSSGDVRIRPEADTERHCSQRHLASVIS